MLRSHVNGDFGFLLRIVGDLKIVERDGSVLVELLGTLPLRLGEHFIGDRALISRKSTGDVVAADLQQYLALFYFVAQASFDRHYAATGKRYHRNSSRDIWIHDSSDDELGRGVVLFRCR